MNNTEIMGVLNITDNSFHDGGKYNSFKKSFQHAKKIIHEGADIIDIGAESSKPGSEPISSKVQIKKIEPVVEAIREISDIPISIDTRSSDVIKKSEIIFKKNPCIVGLSVICPDEMRNSNLDKMPRKVTSS